MTATAGAAMPRVFVTGATGCVGQYVVEALLEAGRFEVHALVRPGADLARRQHLVIHAGTLETIADHGGVVGACHAVIHLATAWDDTARADDINVRRTLELLDAVDAERCRRVIVCSTASILGPDHALLPGAATHGTAYIRSKSRAYERLQVSRWRDRLTIVCPTLVIGGDGSHRPSHVVRELRRLRHLLWGARFISADGRFHFIHGRDLAVMIVRLLDQSGPQPTLVAGQPATSFNDALRALAGLTGKQHLGWLTVTPARVLAACRLGRVRLSPWDVQCIRHPFFDYRVSTPEDVGARSAFPTIDAALRNVLPAGSQA